MKIFVSYTLRDSVLSADALRYFENILSSLGEPYIDILHNTSPDPQGHVLDTLEDSKIFCALITPEYFQSHWVQIELDMAIKRHIPIIAIIVSSQRDNNTLEQRAESLRFVYD
jgi:TIR domain